MRPKGRGRPQRILLGNWPEDHVRNVIRAVVFRDGTLPLYQSETPPPPQPTAPHHLTTTQPSPSSLMMEEEKEAAASLLRSAGFSPNQGADKKGQNDFGQVFFNHVHVYMYLW